MRIPFPEEWGVVLGAMAALAVLADNARAQYDPRYDRYYGRYEHYDRYDRYRRYDPYDDYYARRRTRRFPDDEFLPREPVRHNKPKHREEPAK